MCVTKRLEKVKSQWRQYGVESRACCWQNEMKMKISVKEEGDRKIATEEVWRLSHVLGSLHSWEHLEGLSVHAHTRANAPSLAMFAVTGMPWERPTGRQTFLIASQIWDPRTRMPTHMCAYRHTHTCAHKHTYRFANKRYTLTCISGTNLLHFPN